MRTTLMMLVLAGAAFAQAPGPDVQQYIKISDPSFALTHVRVIDGTWCACTGRPDGSRR